MTESHSRLAEWAALVGADLPDGVREGERGTHGPVER